MASGSFNCDIHSNSGDGRNHKVNRPKYQPADCIIEETVFDARTFLIDLCKKVAGLLVEAYDDEGIFDNEGNNTEWSAFNRIVHNIEKSYERSLNEPRFIKDKTWKKVVSK
jgi:hypothetical protein